jgi:hypothetical protein
MLDFACGYAVLSKLTPGMGFSTLELKVAYHKAMDQGHRPHPRGWDHRHDGKAGGVHGRPAGGCAWRSVCLGHVEPSGDTSNLEERGGASTSIHRSAWKERSRKLSRKDIKTSLDKKSLFSESLVRPMRGR